MNRQFIWVLCIVCIAIGIRSIYAVHSPLYLTTGDSVSYFLTAKKIIATKQLVDPWRTPVYPLILSIPYSFVDQPLPDEISGVYTIGLEYIRIAQSVSMVMATVLLFLLCQQLGIGRMMSALLTLVGTSDFTLLLLEHTIVTESFACVWLVILFYIQLQLLKKFTLFP